MRIPRTAAILGTFLLSTVCTRADNDLQVRVSDADLTTLTNPHISKFAIEIRGSRWPTSTIWVCWEKDSGSYDAYKALVQNAVHDTWQRVSALNFSGWQTCTEHNKGVHLSIQDIQPETLKVGRYLDTVSGGVILNFTLSKWRAPCADVREECIKVIAIHEFGHVLGLVHEGYQPNAPDLCAATVVGPPGDHPLTPYDRNSVMNYCNPHYGNNGALSECDVEAARLMYGASAEPVDVKPCAA